MKKENDAELWKALEQAMQIKTSKEDFKSPLSLALQEKFHYCGRMISGSKSAYWDKYPDNIVFFNANVYDSKGTKVWFGDLDLTKESKKLQKIANESNAVFYVTREQPYRFQKITMKFLNEQIEKEKAEKHHSIVVFEPQKD